MASPVVQQYTYFSVTINNPDDNDLLIVRNPNDKYIRQCIWTHETGAEGTPHIQMWVRLHRNNSLSLIKKLYPRGHFKGIAKDEYNENTHAYAQKDDDTTRGHHVITSTGLPPDVVNILQEVVVRLINRLTNPLWYADVVTSSFKRNWGDIHVARESEEEKMVAEKPHLAKIFVSANYKQIVQRFFHVFWDTQINVNKQTNRQDAEEEVDIPTCHET